MITDNLFENCMTGVVLGGGRDNVVTFNHFVSTDLAVHLDNRGMNWQLQVELGCYPPSSPPHPFQDCNNTAGALVQQLLSVNFTLPPYATAYPAITDSLTFHPCVPVRANVSYNTCVCDFARCLVVPCWRWWR